MEQIGSELEGLVVLDFCAFVAGAFCTRLLARWGAEVIKIESLGGDHLRSMRPLRDGESAYFGSLNAGKRSVSLNLREPEDRDAVLGLMDRADIVMENFRPGVMDPLGLGYEVASARRPELVYGSVSGYGQEVARADRGQRARRGDAEQTRHPRYRPRRIGMAGRSGPATTPGRSPTTPRAPCSRPQTPRGPSGLPREAAAGVAGAMTECSRRRCR